MAKNIETELAAFRELATKLRNNNIDLRTLVSIYTDKMNVLSRKFIDETVGKSNAIDDEYIQLFAFGVKEEK